jgi:hypothetical protein
MWRKTWNKFSNYSRSEKGRRMQSGQALSEYWPAIGGATALVFAAAFVFLSPWLGRTYKTVVDAVDDPSSVEMECVDESSGGGSGPSEAILDIHRVSFNGWVYNDANDTTTVYYEVTSRALGDGPAISHWAFELPCGGTVVSASEAYEYVNPDPKTGINGIKFDQGYDDYETRIVSITFNGNLEKAGGDVAAKYGPKTASSSITVVGCAIENPCE